MAQKSGEGATRGRSAPPPEKGAKFAILLFWTIFGPACSPDVVDCGKVFMAYCTKYNLL